MISIPETVTIFTHNTPIKKPKQFLFDPCGAMYDATQGSVISFLQIAGLDSINYQVTEKLVGIDLAFWIFKSGEIRISSNNGFVDRNFYNCEPLVDWYCERLAPLGVSYTHFKQTDCVIVYGRIVDSKTQPRYSGSPLDFVALEILMFWRDWCNFVNPSDGNEILDLYEIPYAPILTTTRGLSDALAFTYKGSSFHAPQRPWVELIIRPYESSIWLPNGRRFLIKRSLKQHTECDVNILIGDIS